MVVVPVDVAAASPKSDNANEQSDGPKRWIGRFLMVTFLATARSSVSFCGQQRMNRFFILAVATVLLGLHLAHNLFLSQLGLPSGSSLSAWQNRHYYYLGVMFAQPTILAAWTWYGNGSLADRVRWSTLIAFMLGNAVLFSVFVNEGRKITVTDLSTAAYPLIQYATVLGLLFVVARFTRLPTPDRNSRPQVSLKEVLYWIAVFAIGLAGMSAILQSSTVSGTFGLSSILGLLLGPMFMALMSAPIIATMLMVLGIAQITVLKWAVIFLIAQQVILLAIGLLTPPPLIDLLLCELVILVTMHVTAALTAWPFRGSDVVASTPP